uniref:SOWAHA-C winged helix-turn-helix domain-containing protein n=1 Tax=Gouania willdenowi TaxID=441366 RepID=A0A8C5HRJ1_GOUWI
MATELSQDAVLLFLRSSGGSAKNAELLLHFRAFIQDNAEQRRNRELFKKFVNSVATVRQTDGVSYVVLRKKFRGHGPVLPSSDTDRAAGGERHWHTYQQGGEAVSKTKTVLPAAGIVGNASVEAKKHVSSTPGTPGTPGRHSQSLFPALKPSTMCADAAPPQRTEAGSLHSAVPLDPREHDWLVKGAAGAWTDIYSLFREDHSLLNRQDFISGFTVLHWIAKHGNHKVLNTLWYGAEKAGLTFNVNAKSKNGHTPLHIAAIHGNKNILRLLVTKFHADLQLRDTAGKKPWQYLNSNAPLEIFQLLGAPARVVKAGEDVRKVESTVRFSRLTKTQIVEFREFLTHQQSSQTTTEPNILTDFAVLIHWFSLTSNTVKNGKFRHLKAAICNLSHILFLLSFFMSWFLEFN